MHDMNLVKVTPFDLAICQVGNVQVFMRCFLKLADAAMTAMRPHGGILYVC